LPDDATSNLESLLRKAEAPVPQDAGFRRLLRERLCREVEGIARVRRRWRRAAAVAAAAGCLLALGVAFYSADSPPQSAGGFARTETQNDASPKELPPEIRDLLREPEEDVRLHAVLRIAQYGDGRRAEDLERTFRVDESLAVRKAAREALFRIWEREESSRRIRP